VLLLAPGRADVVAAIAAAKCHAKRLTDISWHQTPRSQHISVF
jgi:hypothetical protein